MRNGWLWPGMEHGIYYKLFPLYPAREISRIELLKANNNAKSPL